MDIHQGVVLRDVFLVKKNVVSQKTVYRGRFTLFCRYREPVTNRALLRRRWRAKPPPHREMTTNIWIHRHFKIQVGFVALALSSNVANSRSRAFR